MQLQYASDLHLEFRTHLHGKEIVRKLRDGSDSDVLVLAGDICSIDSFTHVSLLTSFLESVSSLYRDVLYVPGNHEYYNNNLTPKVDLIAAGDCNKEKLAAILSKYPNVTLLDNKIIGLEGKVIAGTTLWWDTDHPMSNVRSNMINDFTWIPGGITWIEKQHQTAIDFIHSLLMEGNAIDCLITHHGVTSKVRERWIGSPSNIYFYSDISKFLQEIDVNYIIHGHQHDNDEYLIPVKDEKFATVTRNCLGYPRHNGNDSTDFDFGAVISL